MMITRDYLVRHPDRCTHKAVCIPVCPTGAWLSTPRINSTNHGVWKRVGCALMPVLHKPFTRFFEKAKNYSFPNPSNRFYPIVLRRCPQ